MGLQLPCQWNVLKKCFGEPHSFCRVHTPGASSPFSNILSYVQHCLQLTLIQERLVIAFASHQLLAGLKGLGA